MTPIYASQKVTSIPSGSFTASAIDLDGFQLVGVIIPSGLSATNMQFDVSTDKSKYYPLISNGALHSVAVSASGHNLLEPADFVSINFVRFMFTGTANGTALTLTAVMRPV